MNKLLKLPKFRVPATGSIQNFDNYDWSGRLLRKPDYIPVVGAWGMFDLYSGGGYPPIRFGRQLSPTELPRTLVIRNSALRIADDFYVELVAAGIDVHGGRPGFESGGWNLSTGGILGTCIPAMSQGSASVVSSGLDNVVINRPTTNLFDQSNRISPGSTGGLANNTTPGYPDPTVLSPGFAHYYSAIESPGDGFSYLNYVAMNDPLGYDSSLSMPITPEDMDELDTAVTDPDQYVGGTMLVIDEASPSQRQCYTSAQYHAVLSDSFLFTHFLHLPYGGSPTLDHDTVSCFRQTAAIAADQAMIAAAMPKFEKVAWHIFLGKINADSLTIRGKNGVATEPDRKAVQLAAFTANLTSACSVDGVTLHNVGDVHPVIDPGEAESIIREFFGL